MSESVEPRTLDKATLSIAKFTDTSGGRPVLEHVWLRGDHALAADGFVLGKVDLPAGDPFIDDVSVPSKLAKHAAARDPEFKDGVLMWTEGGSPATATLPVCPPTPKPFPDVDELLNSNKSKAAISEVALSPAYLKRVCEVVETFLQGDSISVMRVRTVADNVGVLFSAHRTSDKRAIEIMLMPMVLEITKSTVEENSDDVEP